LKDLDMLLDDFIGKQIDDFMILERIGQGGMATVYRAHQASVKRDIALKIIRLGTETAANEDFRRRFAYEAKIIAGLEHIHILPVYAYGVVNDVAYLAMRWLRGGTVGAMLLQGPLSVEHAASLFEQVARGLGYAHSKGIIHRDLKPSNILLDDQGNAYLSDFGLAKMVEGSPEITKSGHLVGTPLYMAPEMLRGEEIDQRADIYSLGMVLYHMLVGRPGFDTATTSNITTLIYSILEKGPTPPRQINPALPEEVETVILKAMYRDRNERYARAEQMADALNAALGRRRVDELPFHLTPPTPSSAPAGLTSPASGTTQSLTASQLRRRARRRWLMVGGLAVTALVMLFVAALLLMGGDEGEEARVLPTETPTATATTAPSLTPTGFPQAAILLGASGPAEEITPNTEQIALAQARLGGEGFIAYVACTQDTDYHAKQAREMRDLATTYGLDFQVYDANTDPYRQLTLVERARAEGAVGLIVCPLDAELLDETLRSVQTAKLPLVLMGSEMPSYGGVKVAGDEYQMGLSAGQYAGRLIRDELGGQASVIILDFPDMPAIVTRADGLEDGVLEFAPDAAIIGRYVGGTPELGKESVAKLLAAGVKFDVIVSINDAGAIGAIQAMVEADIAPDAVIVVSIDAETQALDYIRQSYFIRGSEAVNREAFSRAAINALVWLLAGATLPETVNVPPGEMVTGETLAGSGSLTPTPSQG
jgi:serine/threonine-protein kinase